MKDKTDKKKGKQPLLINPLTTKTSEEAYKFYCENWSDVHELLPIFLEYGQQAQHITEFGVRTGRSTTAWLNSKPKHLICYDITQPKNLHLDLYKKFANDNNTNFKFIIADTLTIDIDPTELLFIDTIHTYTQVYKELTLHYKKVSKFILLHDTETFGKVGMDHKKPALLQAIIDFLKIATNWNVHKVYNNNNGLTILKNKTI